LTTVEERIEQSEIDAKVDKALDFLREDERFKTCDIAITVHPKESAPFTQHRLMNLTKGGVSPSDVYGLALAGKDSLINMRRELRSRHFYGLWFATFLPRRHRK
jgi:hypothetical protein